MEIHVPERSHTTGVTLIRQIDDFGDGGFYVVSNKPGVRHVLRHPARAGTIACDQDEAFIPIAFSTPRSIIFFTIHYQYAALDRKELDVLL